MKSYLKIAIKRLRKPILPYIELHLTDHCNLNCRGCVHFAPIANRWFADPEEHARDLSGLQRLFSTIEVIRLMGGEPLLHPQVDSFVLATRSYFPKADIRLVTNGLLLDRMPEGFWDACKCCSVVLDITVYPPFAANSSSVLKLADSKGVRHYAREVTTFHAQMNLKGDSDAEDAFLHCRSRGYYPHLRGGKLHICWTTALVHHFNQRFQTHIPSGGYVDIRASGITGWDVIELLERPALTCRYCCCDSAQFPWSASTNLISEWEAKTYKKTDDGCPEQPA